MRLKQIASESLQKRTRLGPQLHVDLEKEQREQLSPLHCWTCRDTTAGCELWKLRYVPLRCIIQNKQQAIIHRSSAKPAEYSSSAEEDPPGPQEPRQAQANGSQVLEDLKPVLITTALPGKVTQAQMELYSFAQASALQPPTALLAANFASRVQAILLPQPPKYLGSQAPTTTPGRDGVLPLGQAGLKLLTSGDPPAWPPKVLGLQAWPPRLARRHILCGQSESKRVKGEALYTKQPDVVRTHYHENSKGESALVIQSPSSRPLSKTGGDNLTSPEHERERDQSNQSMRGRDQSNQSMRGVTSASNQARSVQSNPGHERERDQSNQDTRGNVTSQTRTREGT
ncbi:hypothetical protein AAY473_037781 [Plecturocebus cupreus]